MDLISNIYVWLIALSVIAVVVAIFLSPILALKEFIKNRKSYDKKSVAIVILIFFIAIPLIAYIIATRP